jgi:hypothetical protein
MGLGIGLVGGNKNTYTVASSSGPRSLSPPSTPSASNSPRTFPRRESSDCNRSPSMSRSLACLAILNFSVSSFNIVLAWSVGLCWATTWLCCEESVLCVLDSLESVPWRDWRFWERNWESVERESEMRRSESRSPRDLKLAVHCDMSCAC